MILYCANQSACPFNSIQTQRFFSEVVLGTLARAQLGFKPNAKGGFLFCRPPLACVFDDNDDDNHDNQLHVCVNFHLWGQSVIPYQLVITSLLESERVRDRATQ